MVTAAISEEELAWLVQELRRVSLASISFDLGHGAGLAAPLADPTFEKVGLAANFIERT